MPEKYIRTIEDGINAMVGKAIPLGTRGIVLETTDNGCFVEFNHPKLKHIWISNDQCEPWERCHSCNLLRINGYVTHETGCPNAWRDEVRECKWCGCKFLPEENHQVCCSHPCQVSYSGVDCDCEECHT